MMFWKAFLVVLLASVALSIRPADATVVVSVSSPSNLSALTVGQKVEIDVSLKGLPSSNNQTDFIFNLNTKVLFSASLFQSVADPTSLSGLTAAVAPGSVFNNAQGSLQVANFNFQGVKPDGLADSSLATSAATGIFSQYPNTSSGAISLNGLYYSFILQAKATGSGSISFDSTAGANVYAANETGFNYAPLPTDGSLAFTISSALPEPSSLAFATIASAIVGLWPRARKHPAA